jgi:hypothetical protein
MEGICHMRCARLLTSRQIDRVPEVSGGLQCGHTTNGEMENTSLNVPHTVLFSGIVTHVSHNNFFCTMCIHFRDALLDSTISFLLVYR